MAHWHIADTQSTALSIVSSEAKCFSIIISFVGHKRELSHRKLCIPLQTKHVLGKKFGGRVEQDQKAWAWKLDSHLCLSHFEHFFFNSRYKVQDTRFVSAPNTPLICYQYLTDGLPMHCWHTMDTIATDCWPTVDLSIWLSILDQYKTNTQLIRDVSSTRLNRNIDQYVNRHSANISINMSSKTQPIFWRIRWSTPAIRNKTHIKYKT